MSYFYDGDQLYQLKPAGDQLWTVYEVTTCRGELMDWLEVGEAEGFTPEEAEADWLSKLSYVHVDEYERFTPYEPYTESYSYWD